MGGQRRGPVRRKGCSREAGGPLERTRRNRRGRRACRREDAPSSRQADCSRREERVQREVGKQGASEPVASSRAASQARKSRPQLFCSAGRSHSQQLSPGRSPKREETGVDARPGVRGQCCSTGKGSEAGSYGCQSRLSGEEAEERARTSAQRCVTE